MLLRSVDFPTLGNPMSAADACPLFFTAKLRPPAPLRAAARFSASALRRATFAFRRPMCCWVALLYSVSEISFSTSAICCSMFAIALLGEAAPPDKTPCSLEVEGGVEHPRDEDRAQQRARDDVFGAVVEDRGGHANADGEQRRV